MRLTRNTRHSHVSFGAVDDLLPQGFPIWTGESAVGEEDAIQSECDFLQRSTEAIPNTASTTDPARPDFVWRR
jgi:hypothetical protein